MSGKRYYLTSVCGDEGLYDKENGCIIVNKNSLLDLDKNWNTIVGLLNEQQAIIKHLTIEKHQADKRFQTIIAELKKDNEQLRKELDNFKPVMFQDIRKGTVILYSKGD